MLKKIKVFNNPMYTMAAEAEGKLIRDLFCEIKESGLSFREVKDTIDCAADIVADGNLLKLLDCSDAPSECRVHTWYEPTYYLAAILIYYALREESAVLGAPSYKALLERILRGSTERQFYGHGYEATASMAEALLILSEAGVYEFIKSHPTLCPEFTTAIQKATAELRSVLKNKKTDNDFEPYCRETIKRIMINKTPEQHRVFVYGTLMTGKTNNYLLQDALCCGDHCLNDYALYDLGAYPAIVHEKGQQVVGELWLVSERELSQLHRLESEGDLYKYTPVILTKDNLSIPAHAYVYLNTVRQTQYLDVTRLPWDSNQSDCVWYAAYGSNLLAERFSYYIQGGTCSLNGKTYGGSTDKTPPQKSLTLKIKGQIFFAGRSLSWDNGGVAFLDTASEKTVLSKAYLITREQFEDVWQQEGKSNSWYGKPVFLGAIENIPVYSFTAAMPQEANQPTQKYIEVLRKGIKEAYPTLSDTYIDDYLEVAKNHIPEGNNTNK